MKKTKDFVPAAFYRTQDIQTLFGFRDKRAVWRAASGRGWLAPFVRRFGQRQLLFDKAGVDRLVANGAGG